MSKPDTSENYQPISNGWTQYQKLVLTELERHQNKLDNLERELTSMRIINARLESELKSNTVLLQQIAEDIKKNESILATKISTLQSEKSGLVSDIKMIKWTVSTFAAVTASVVSIVMKIFWHI